MCASSSTASINSFAMLDSPFLSVISLRNMSTGGDAAGSSKLLIHEQLIQLVHKGLDVAKLAIDRGEAHIGHFVQLL